jgi:hypothetical protein
MGDHILVREVVEVIILLVQVVMTNLARNLVSNVALKEEK